MRECITQSAKLQGRPTNGVARARVAHQGLDRLRSLPNDLLIEQRGPEALQCTYLVPKLRQLGLGRQLFRQIIHCALKTRKLPPNLPSNPAMFGRERSAAGNRPNRCNGSARHEHQLQVEGTGECHQTRQPEIDGPALDPGDVTLGYRRVGAQLALADALGFTGISQRIGQLTHEIYNNALVQHLDIFLRIVYQNPNRARPGNTLNCKEERLGQCTAPVPPCCRNDGSAPMRRITASHMSSGRVSKTMSRSTSACSQLDAASSASSCPAAHPA